MVSKFAVVGVIKNKQKTDLVRIITLEGAVKYRQQSRHSSLSIHNVDMSESSENMDGVTVHTIDTYYCDKKSTSEGIAALNA